MVTLAEVKLKAPHILNYGPPGTGKTAFALTLGSKAVILDLDGGLLTGRTLKDKWFDERQKVQVVQCLEDDPKKALAFGKCRAQLDGIVEAVGRGQGPQALVLDSLTALGEFALRQILAANNRLGGQVEIQHWGQAMALVEQVLMYLRSLPIVVVLIAHEQLIDDDDDKTVRTLSVIGKKLLPKVPAFFDEMWYSKVVNLGGGKTKYVVKTKATGGMQCRSRANAPDDFDQSLGFVEILKQMGYDFPERK